MPRTLQQLPDYDRAVLACSEGTRRRPDDDDLTAEIRRCRRDFQYFAEKYLKIRRPDTQLVPFKFKRAQRYLWNDIMRPRIKAGEPVRIYDLKSRQVGSSTFFEAVGYWITSLWPNAMGSVIAHETSASAKLFRMTQLYYKHAPKDFRPTLKRSNRSELYFANPSQDGEVGLESELIVSTAGSGDDLEAGSTLRFAHLSEFGRWDKRSRDVPSMMATFLQTVHEVAGTVVALETTAQGPNYAEEFWYADNGFDKVFLPWISDETYSARDPLDASDFETDGRYGDEHAVYAQIRDLLPLWYPELDTDEKLDHEARCRMAWRRYAISRKCAGKLELFYREYPLSPEEAFSASGSTFFDLAELMRAGKVAGAAHAGEPPALWVYSSDEDEFVMQRVTNPDRLDDDPAGGLLTYTAVADAGRYVIGADPGGGYEDGDPSAAQVLRHDGGRLEQVAVLHGYINPVPFATLLKVLAEIFNDAYIVCEATGCGIATCWQLGTVLQYPHMFLRSTDAGDVKWGFSTSPATKPDLLFHAQAQFNEGAILLRHPGTVNQLRSFRELSPGRWGAPRGKHDDLVMALALALRGVREASLGRVVHPKDAEPTPWERFAHYADYLRDTAPVSEGLFT